MRVITTEHERRVENKPFGFHPCHNEPASVIFDCTRRSCCPGSAMRLQEYYVSRSSSRTNASTRVKLRIRNNFTLADDPNRIAHSIRRQRTRYEGWVTKILNQGEGPNYWPCTNYWPLFIFLRLKMLFMSNIISRFLIYSLLCSFFYFTGPRIKFYNIVNFKNFICESARIEPPSAIFLSTLLRSDTSENAIKVANAICNLLITYHLLCLQINSVPFLSDLKV